MAVGADPRAGLTQYQATCRAGWRTYVFTTWAADADAARAAALAYLAEQDAAKGERPVPNGEAWKVTKLKVRCGVQHVDRAVPCRAWTVTAPCTACHARTVAGGRRYG